MTNRPTASSTGLAASHGPSNRALSVRINPKKAGRMSEGQDNCANDPDARRRQYLWRSACARMGYRLCTNISVFLWVTALLGVPLTLVLFVRSMAPEYPEAWRSAVLWLVVTISSGVLGYLLLRWAEYWRRRARALAYVPPVAEQVSALRANEVLVRGSAAPTALPGELVRAAQAGQQGTEGLLRAADDNTQ